MDKLAEIYELLEKVASGEADLNQFAEHIPAVLTEAGEIIEKQAAEIITLRQKQAEAETFKSAVALLNHADEKGVTLSSLIGEEYVTQQEKVAALMDQADSFEAIENGIKLSSGGLGFTTIGENDPPRPAAKGEDYSSIENDLMSIA